MKTESERVRLANSDINTEKRQIKTETERVRERERKAWSDGVAIQSKAISGPEP